MDYARYLNLKNRSDVIIRGFLATYIIQFVKILQCYSIQKDNVGNPRVKDK